jgi:hypothetical protein
MKLYHNIKTPNHKVHKGFTQSLQRFVYVCVDFVVLCYFFVVFVVNFSFLHSHIKNEMSVILSFQYYSLFRNDDNK